MSAAACRRIDGERLDPARVWVESQDQGGDDPALVRGHPDFLVRAAETVAQRFFRSAAGGLEASGLKLDEGC